MCWVANSQGSRKPAPRRRANTSVRRSAVPPYLEIVVALSLAALGAACEPKQDAPPDDPELFCARFDTRGDCAGEQIPGGGSLLTCQWVEATEYAADTCGGTPSARCLPIRTGSFGCFSNCPGTESEYWFRPDDGDGTVVQMPMCGNQVESEAWTTCGEGRGFPCSCACEGF